MKKDGITTIQQLKNKVQNFCEDRDWDQFHSPKDLAIDLILESAEVLEPFRFKSNIEIERMLLNNKKKEEISNEISDVLFCLLRFVQMNNIDLSTAFNKKVKKLNKKYPISKCRGKNKKYTEL